jgi:hypothetical protein
VRRPEIRAAAFDFYKKILYNNNGGKDKKLLGHPTGNSQFWAHFFLLARTQLVLATTKRKVEKYTFYRFKISGRFRAKSAVR